MLTVSDMIDARGSYKDVASAIDAAARPTSEPCVHPVHPFDCVYAYIAPVELHSSVIALACLRETTTVAWHIP